MAHQIGTDVHIMESGVVFNRLSTVCNLIMFLVKNVFVLKAGELILPMTLRWVVADSHVALLMDGTTTGWPQHCKISACSM